ncbi:MAG: sigma-70 family RNA polymerase sigma factor [Bacteroidales bacterium]|nr:sigma-70 family RNA polymerase sigma factor [Bacteroidales bacterium]
MSITYNISEIRTGNRNEFGKLVEEDMDYIYKTALMIMANEEDARDIVQDTFVTAWDKRRSIKDSESLRPYLRKISINKCYDQLRRRKRWKEEFSVEDESAVKSLVSDENPVKKIENDEAVSLIKTAVSGLSPRQRIIFTMIELEGMSHSEVSELTGMKKTSIKSNLTHARKKLDEKLKDYLS